MPEREALPTSPAAVSLIMLTVLFRPSLAADIDVTAWERPRIFQRISDAGNIAAREMYRVFNMGIGLVAIVPAERLDEALAAVPNAIVIGSVVPRETEEAVRLVGVDG